MKSERDWQKYEREAPQKRVDSETDARKRRLAEASKLGPSTAGHGSWVVGAFMLAGGVLLLHHATADEPKKDDKKAPPADAKGTPALPAPAPSTPPTPAPTTRTSSLPVGAHVEAQDARDGKWYGATVRYLDLTNGNAVQWDAGTPGYARNPKTRSSPATATRALGAAPAPGSPAKGAPPASPLPVDPAAAVKAAATAAQQLGGDSPLASLFGSPSTGGAR